MAAAADDPVDNHPVDNHPVDRHPVEKDPAEIEAAEEYSLLRREARGAAGTIPTSRSHTAPATRPEPVRLVSWSCPGSRPVTGS